MTSTITRKLNNFVTTAILGSTSPEARADKQFLEDTKRIHGGRLSTALREGGKIKMPEDAALRDAEETLAMLIENKAEVRHFVPDVDAFLSMIARLEVTKVEEFLVDSNIDSTIEQIRSVADVIEMDAPAQLNNSAIRGGLNEDMRKIATELGIKGDSLIAAFCYVYSGATIGRVGMRRQIFERASRTQKAVYDTNASMRYTLIKYVDERYLARSDMYSRVVRQQKQRDGLYYGAEAGFTTRLKNETVAAAREVSTAAVEAAMGQVKSHSRDIEQAVTIATTAALEAAKANQPDIEAIVARATAAAVEAAMTAVMKSLPALNATVQQQAAAELAAASAVTKA
jgi:hypothetical protein